jgi:AraC-like DNA-binding protein
MRHLWVRLLTFELLMLLQKDWRATANQVSASPDALESLAAAMDLVFSTRRLLTTREAAAACGMSVSTFRQSFKAATGISFAKFALRHRLWGAAAQLLRGSDTLTTVAAAWGFTDDSHFHHCFLRHYGCPPGAYRRRQRAAARAPRKSASNPR